MLTLDGVRPRRGKVVTVVRGKQRAVMVEPSPSSARSFASCSRLAAAPAPRPWLLGKDSCSGAQSKHRGCQLRVWHDSISPLLRKGEAKQHQQFPTRFVIRQLLEDPQPLTTAVPRCSSFPTFAFVLRGASPPSVPVPSYFSSALTPSAFSMATSPFPRAPQDRTPCPQHPVLPQPVAGTSSGPAKGRRVAGAYLGRSY